jgi:fatty acid desaturase
LLDARSPAGRKQNANDRMHQTIPETKEFKMNIDRAVFLFAGLMVLVGLTLAYFVSPYWILLTVFVGLNLFQSGITGFCPLAIILKKLGVQPGSAFK